MWNEAPESKYHTLPIKFLAMNTIRVKSSSNCEAKASIDVVTANSFLLEFLCGHFVA